MTVRALKYHLSSYHLDTTGRREQLLKRLLRHLNSGAHSSPATRNDNTTSSATTTTAQRQPPGPSGTGQSSADSSESASGSDSSESDHSQISSTESAPDSSESEHPSSSAGPGSVSHHHSRDRHRHRSRERRSRHSRKRHHSPQGHRRKRQSSSVRRHRQHSSRTRYHSSRHHKSRRSRTSSSSSSLSTTDRSRSRKRHRSPSSSDSTSSYSRHRRRYHRYYTSSSDSSPSRHPSGVSCAPPVSSKLVHRIRRGKYVNFDKLLTPPDTPPFAIPTRHKKQRRQPKECRRVTDLASWLEAWNRYLCTRLSFQPSMALELAKYQTLIVMLFSQYSSVACLRYDALFRQAASQDPTLKWDTIREDIYVWSLTRHPSSPTPSSSHHSDERRLGVTSFRDRPPVTSRLGPPVQISDKATHTATGREICRRYNFNKCTRGDECTFAHVCWLPGCLGAHPGRGCPNRRN